MSSNDKIVNRLHKHAEIIVTSVKGNNSVVIPMRNEHKRRTSQGGQKFAPAKES